MFVFRLSSFKETNWTWKETKSQTAKQVNLSVKKNGENHRPIWKSETFSSSPIHSQQLDQKLQKEIEGTEKNGNIVFQI